MRVLVLTTSTRTAWWAAARGSLLAAHPDADVVPVWCDARGLAPVPVDGLVPPRRTGDGDRFADLALALGERAAGVAVLPEVVAAAGGGPAVVVSDTVCTLAPWLDRLAPLAGDALVARPAPVAAGAPGAAPAALLDVVGVARFDDGLRGWWAARRAEALRHRGADPMAALARLPAGAVRWVDDPAVRLGTRTAADVDVADDGSVAGAVDGSVAGSVAGAAPGREPVALVDLDGVDPARPWWFAPPDGAPARPLSTSPGLAAVVRAAVSWLGPDATRPEPPLLPGVRVTAGLRRWFRSCLADGAGPVPNALVPGEVQEFLDALAAAAPALALEQRPDVAAAFARPEDRPHLLRWAWGHGLSEGAWDLALLPDPVAVAAAPVAAPAAGPAAPPVVGPAPSRVPASVARPGAGVNVVGYLDGELGLGVAARRTVEALRSAGIEVATVDYDRTSSRRRRGTGHSAAADAPFDVSLLCITADQLPLFVADVGPGFLEGRHNVGLWYWETDVLPPEHRASFRFVDEVWGATRYLRDVFAAVAPPRVAVRHVPVPLTFADPAVQPGDRARLGLDDRFTVLFSFDYLSVVARKNPLGLVEAYRRAFGPDDGARLVLKSINGDRFAEEVERLAWATADRPDIELRDEYLSARDRLALVAVADCYASLHRSEGLGLTMAEAMSVGTPVVATAYSGNLDFTDDGSALLVPAVEVPVGPGLHYPAEGRWADPDLDVAAAHLRRLREDPALRARLAAAGPAALAPFGTVEVGRRMAAALSGHVRSAPTRAC